MSHLTNKRIRFLSKRGGGFRCYYGHKPSRILRGVNRNEWRKKLGNAKGWAIIDHRQSLSKNGADNLENMVLCCEEYNREKGSGDFQPFYDSKALLRKHYDG